MDDGAILSGAVRREDIQPRTINWDNLPEKSDLRSDEIFIHRLPRLSDIRKRYEALGWDTTISCKTLGTKARPRRNQSDFRMISLNTGLHYLNAVFKSSSAFM